MIKINTYSIKIALFAFLLVCFLFNQNSLSQTHQSSNDLLEELFKDWRSFEHPPLIEGVPDYSQKTFDKRQVKKKRDWNREKARLLSKNNK